MLFKPLLRKAKGHLSMKPVLKSRINNYIVIRVDIIKQLINASPEYIHMHLVYLDGTIISEQI